MIANLAALHRAVLLDNLLPDVRPTQARRVEIRVPWATAFGPGFALGLAIGGAVAGRWSMALLTLGAIGCYLLVMASSLSGVSSVNLRE